MTVSQQHGKKTFPSDNKEVNHEEFVIDYGPGIQELSYDYQPLLESNLRVKCISLLSVKQKFEQTTHRSRGVSGVESLSYKCLQPFTQSSRSPYTPNFI